MTEKPIEKYSFRKMWKRERPGVGCPTHLIHKTLTVHLEVGGRRECALPHGPGFSAAAMAPATGRMIREGRAGKSKAMLFEGFRPRPHPVPVPPLFAGLMGE
jgi:hypothetical protein